jgi:hypothetical protein
MAANLSFPVRSVNLLSRPDLASPRARPVAPAARGAGEAEAAAGGAHPATARRVAAGAGGDRAAAPAADPQTARLVLQWSRLQ